MARSKRKAIPDSVRFEVFKRDSFKCQYCGQSAPDVILVIDHIEPVSKGGDNDLMNLITSCRDCNSGKSDRRLDDDSVIAKQRAQLEELTERRNQLEMMLQWREGVRTIEDRQTEAIVEEYTRRVPGWYLNESGLATVNKFLRRHGFDRTMSALETAADAVIEIRDGKATQESVNRLFQYWHVSVQPDDVQSCYRIRGIVRKRHYGCHDGIALGLLKKAVKLGAPIDDLFDWANRSTSWSNWRTEMQDWIDHLESDPGEEEP